MVADTPAPTRFAALFLGIALVVVACGGATADRQTEVALRGAEVMPFDLDATTHRFDKTTDGGIQTVTADDPADEDQVRLVREHLLDERDKFASGNFDDPARIHGMDMPGVAELSSGYRRIAVTYAEVPAGAELRYTTDDATLSDAIHAWFDRQVADHGTHAEAGPLGI
jgi:hypothetical protein